MSSKHRLTRSFRTLSALVYLVSSFLLTAKALKIVHVTPAVFTVALPIYIFISLYSFYLFILKRMALSCMIVILCLFPISTFIFQYHYVSVACLFNCKQPFLFLFFDLPWNKQVSWNLGIFGTFHFRTSLSIFVHFKD